MPKFVITFEGHNSLEFSSWCDDDLNAGQHLMLFVVTERLRHMAVSAAAKKEILDLSLTPVITCEMAAGGQGPITIDASNLGCPRDQMLVAAGYLAELMRFNLTRRRL